MKLKANDYEAKDILKIMREWTELTQIEFADSVGLSNKSIQAYELGVKHCLFNVFLAIAKEHGIEITLEKKK